MKIKAFEPGVGPGRDGNPGIQILTSIPGFDREKPGSDSGKMVLESRSSGVILLARFYGSGAAQIFAPKPHLRVLASAYANFQTNRRVFLISAN